MEKRRGYWSLKLPRIFFRNKEKPGESEDSQNQEGTAIGGKVEDGDGNKRGEDERERASHAEQAYKASVLGLDVFEEITFATYLYHAGADASDKKYGRP